MRVHCFRTDIDDEDIPENVTTVRTGFQDDERNIRASCLFDLDLNASDSEDDFGEEDDEPNDDESLP